MFASMPTRREQQEKTAGSARGRELRETLAMLAGVIHSERDADRGQLAPSAAVFARLRKRLGAPRRSRTRPSI